MQLKANTFIPIRINTYKKKGEGEVTSSLLLLFHSNELL
jgi:hypothetical protein